MKRINLITIIILLSQSIIILISFFWNISSAKDNMYKVVKSQGDAFFSELITSRAWNAQHGGVYVPVSDKLQPNPHLDVPNRDVYTTDSVLLTKINPAFMTRLVSVIAEKKNGIHYHITSLNPIRPENKADNWETKALQNFENGKKIEFEFLKKDTVFKYMAPLMVNDVCMKCHAKQGYQVGDVRGGISINIPASEPLTALIKQNTQITILHVAVFIFAIIFTLIFTAIIKKNLKKIKDRNNEINEVNEALMQTNEEISTQNEEIENQREHLELKNEQINSSIRYARTIQQASLPFSSDISKFYPNFIVFAPKDIVSGDFYWIAETSNYNFIAVADCTGHGVPGAFMSMICIRLLNLIVKDRGIEEPFEIFLKLNKSIRKALKQDISDNKDGLDICLCRIDKEQTGEITKVVFAGAKRPLYYFSSKNNNVERIRGSRASIGGYKTRKEIFFEQKETEVSKNDILYLTSDGYTDQNGPNNQRIGGKGFVKLIDKYKHLSLSEQKEELINFMANHQKHYPQRDDITILALLM